MATQAPERAGSLKHVSELLETGNVDTVYRDLYVQRARTLMSGVLSSDEFRRIEQEKADLGTLPVMIGRAVEKSDWARVKELSSRGDALRRSAEGRDDELQTARNAYVITDVRLDPFSPGLLPFTGLAAKDLAALRTQAVEHLSSLERADAPWKDFYAKRRAALQALAVTASESSIAAASMDPQEAAQRALKSGDLRGLAQLADRLMAAATPAKGGTTSPKGTDRPTAASTASADLLTNFSDDTLQAARRLGLAPRRLEPRTELASLRQYAWNPVVADESGRIGVKQVPLPSGTPEGLRERLEMLMIHPLINSGGARHLPKLVAEDVLVEDFRDPKEGDEAPASELLTLLGLRGGRRGLSRIAIEQRLLDRGSEVLEQQLRLDPRGFRLVCIPPDVHLRLGEAEGWGRQPFWTHFDGYLVMADGRLRALAGGEARFGGLFNLVGISRDYDSERVMARFAVVRRERMVAW